MVELYPHQRKAVDELHNGAILFGDVGTGKSLTAMAYYVERESPRRVIVITTAKKRDSLDWQRDAARFAVGGDRDSTFHGVLTVDSWNNVDKYADVEDAFFIFDEQRIVGAGAWTKAFIKIAKRNHWILLTATPGDTWLDYIPVFIAAGYFKNRTEFLREHVVFNRFSKFPKVDRYTSVGKLVKIRNEMLVEMPYLRHTERKTTIVPVDYDVPKFEKVLNERWHVFEQRPLRDVAELFLVMRKVVNSDSSRIRAIRKLMEDHPKLIIFYSHNYELEALRTLSGPASTEPTLRLVGTESSSKQSSESTSLSVSAATPLSAPNGSARTTGTTTSTTTSGSGPAPVIAEWNGHKHEPVPTSDRWVYLVQYVAGSEGWNCIETDAMVFYSLTYSYKNWHQAHGRIDRLNTPFKTLYYYVLMSNSLIDKAIWRSLMGKKNFNENRFLRQIVDTDSQMAA